MMSQDQGGEADNMGRRDRAAVASRQTAARDARNDRNARRANPDLGARAAEIRREYADGPDKFGDRRQCVMRVGWKFAKSANRRNAQHPWNHAGKSYRPAFIARSRAGTISRHGSRGVVRFGGWQTWRISRDRKSKRLNSSHANN